MLKCYPTCKFTQFHAGGARIISALTETSQLMQHDLFITCACEGHVATDPHTLGKAYDISVKTLTEGLIFQVFRHLREVLGAKFTVLYESPVKPESEALSEIVYLNSKATGPHIHIQVRKGEEYP